ncbi:MAG: hypothetical protein ACTSYZ_04025 [Candidatus Helarchaeota archaeon]
MKSKLIKELYKFFKRIPQVRPIKEGEILIKVGNLQLLLQYDNDEININNVKDINKEDFCVLKISRSSFNYLFKAKDINDYYSRLLNIVLYKKDMKLEVNENIKPMRNAFFKILSINRGKGGKNRYELMVGYL